MSDARAGDRVAHGARAEMAAFRTEPFVPQPALRHGHLQTIFGELWPRSLGAGHAKWQQVCRQELLDMPDGDQVLAWSHLQPDDPGRTRPLVLHLHGLEGSADSSYQRGLSAKTFAAGFHSVRLNFRNCGDTEHLARGFYFGAKTDDLLAVLAILRHDWGFARLLVTGASLGANMVLRMLADAGERPPEGLLGAVSVSAPIDMAMTCDAVGRGLNKVYDVYFLAQLARKIRRKIRLSPDGERLRPFLAEFRRIRTLRDFDEYVTAPLGGYAGSAAYYAAGSSGPDLHRIRVPTLLVHARDDPFLPFAMYERQMADIRANPCLVPVFPARGGHVGFWAAPSVRRHEPWMDERWVENEAVRFLLAAAG
jgi:predicted alpha/beta-fold hydrolase